jgi:hypothetical protein
VPPQWLRRHNPPSPCRRPKRSLLRQTPKELQLTFKLSRVILLFMHPDVKWLFGLLIVFAAIFFSSGGLGKLTAKKPFLDPLSTQSSDNFSHIGANSSDNIRYVSVSGQSGVKTLTTSEEIAKGLHDAGIKADEIKKELAALEEASHASPLTEPLAEKLEASTF